MDHPEKPRKVLTTDEAEKFADLVEDLIKGLNEAAYIMRVLLEKTTEEK